MAINFPSNPTNGDTVTVGGINYVYDSTQGVWSDSPQGLAQSIDNLTDVDTSTTAPANRQVLQWSSTNEEWGPADSGVQVYATIDDLPLSGVTEGSMALVDSTDKLYIFSDAGWYSIAIVNQTPSITGVNATYTLAADGTATTVTITATDPEGLPITYSIASDTSGNIATVSQGTGSNTNVFTITPSTNTTNAGTFSLTFRASDGVNIATAVSEFTLEFTISNSNYTTALITSVGANNAVNNSFDDASTNNHTITATGNATQNTLSPYRHGGYSTYFDGNDDYLQLPSHSLLAMGTSEFTWEFWVYLKSDTGATQNLLDLRNGSSGLKIDIATSSLAIRVYSEVTSSNPITGDSLDLNKWYHVALVRDSSDNLKMYLNGSQTGSTATSHTSNYTSNSGRIGIRYSDLTQEMHGYISDARIVKGTAVYTSAFTPPTERLTAITNTSLLTCHLPYIAGDVAPVGYTGSGSIIGSSDNLNSGTLANAFDGSLSTSVAIRNSGSFIEFTFPQQQTGELQVNITNGNDSGDNNVRFWIDGVEGTPFDVSSQTWFSLTSSSDSFTTVKLEHSGSTTANIYGFRIGTSGDTITGLRADITINGNTMTEPFSPYDYQSYSASSNGGSVSFDGTGDYLTIADDASFTIGSGDFTAECWVYPTASPNQPLIFGQWSNPYSWAIQLSNDGNRYARMIFHDGNYQDTVTSTPVALNAWTHLAIVKSGSTATLYVNGVPVGTDTVGTLTDASSALTLGALSSGGQTFQGNIANARLVVGTAVYTSNFTPPTAPLTAITNTELLINGTDAGIIDKSQSSRSVTLYSGAKSSTTQSKYLSSSIAFNGTSDWLRVYSNETLEFSNKDFTIEGWMYCTDSSVTNYVLDARTSSTTGVSGIWLMSTRVIRIYNGGLYDSAAISASDLDDQWLHFAVVRNGSTLQWYINGTASGSAHSVNNNSFFNQQGEHWAIGRNNFSASGYFNGYMSDLRFTKGLARYTSNFTPPTEALKG